MALQPHASIRDIDMPRNIRHLGLTEQGWPRLFFADKVNGQLDLRVMDPRKLTLCIKQRRCWLCGQPLGRYLAFVAGPMCVITRTSAEPPSHWDCAYYAVHACPFLTRPRMHRREAGMPEDVSVSGIVIKRNPGVSAILVTRDYSVWRPDGRGVLIAIGKPERVEWYAEGRKATLEEVRHSIETGLPALENEARKDRDPIGALAELSRRQHDIESLLPFESILPL
jgi:hypothetical protein